MAVSRRQQVGRALRVAPGQPLDSVTVPAPPASSASQPQTPRRNTGTSPTNEMGSLPQRTMVEQGAKTLREGHGPAGKKGPVMPVIRLNNAAELEEN